MSDGKSFLTVGDRLQVTRESKSISVDEVAAQLKLSKEMIENLESDQWDQLPGRPYARGYYIGYVNFLGLPEEEMLALFDLEYTHQEPSIEGFKREKKSNDFSLVPLFFVAVASLVAWFGYQEWKKNESDISSISQAATGSSVEEPVIDDNYFAAMENYPLTGLDVAENGLDEMSIPPTSESITPSTEAMLATEQEEVEVELLEERAVNEPIILTTNIKMLVMLFAEDCWVEVIDSNNKKILNRIVKANEEVKLTGALPLKVLLGNASAVKVLYDDIEFNVTPFARGNVARFSLGEESE